MVWKNASISNVNTLYIDKPIEVSKVSLVWGIPSMYEDYSFAK